MRQDPQDGRVAIPDGPRDTDVCCGRGKGLQFHPGNRKFHEIIRGNLERYDAASSKVDMPLCREQAERRERALQAQLERERRDARQQQEVAQREAEAELRAVQVRCHGLVSPPFFNYYWRCHGLARAVRTPPTLS